MTRKVVVNANHRQFSLSRPAAQLLGLQVIEHAPLFGRDFTVDGESMIARDDERLVMAVESLGQEAGAPGTDLRIVQIPDDVDWFVDNYDGSEWVATKHERWYPDESPAARPWEPAPEHRQRGKP